MSVINHDSHRSEGVLPDQDGPAGAAVPENRPPVCPYTAATSTAAQFRNCVVRFLRRPLDPSTGEARLTHRSPVACVDPHALKRKRTRRDDRAAGTPWPRREQSRMSLPFVGNKKIRASPKARCSGVPLSNGINSMLAGAADRISASCGPHPITRKRTCGSSRAIARMSKIPFRGSSLPVTNDDIVFNRCRTVVLEFYARTHNHGPGSRHAHRYAELA